MRLRIRVPETGDAGQTGATLTSSGEKGRMKREGRNAHFTHFIAPIAVSEGVLAKERTPSERAGITAFAHPSFGNRRSQF